MDDYEGLLQVHLTTLSKEKLNRMAQMIAAELRRRAGHDDGAPLFGDKKADAGPPCPYDDIVESYHLALPMLPKVRIMTVSRTAAMRKFWAWVLTSKKSDGTRRAENAQQAIEWVDAYFMRAAENDFLTGRNQRATGAHAGWKADIDYLLTERGRKHVIEKTAVSA